MIRVIITGPPSGTGFMPYRVDWWVRGEPAIIGVSRYPLIDAARKLKQMGLMDSTVIGLFDMQDQEWKMRTTVGYGAKQAIEDEVRAFRPMPLPLSQPQPRYDLGTGFDYFWRKSEEPLTPEQIMEAAEALDRITNAPKPSATPSEPQRRLRKQPEQPAYTGQAAATPATSAKPHRKRRRGGSGGRRGGRSGR
jgi:hypothetical protein